MDSLSPFLQDSFIPYLMPVYPGAPQQSTGARTEAGKQRSSQNATTHGLTATSPLLPSEDRATYDHHCRQFLDEYNPATPTETHLVQELADTSWRLRRIPLLEADVLSRAANPPNEEARIEFDIVDALNLVTKLSLYGARLSRQFQKAVDQLRDIQDDRREGEHRQLRQAAELLIQHDSQRIQWNPADDGFVFSRQQVEQFATREIRLANARIYSSAAFDLPPQFCRTR